MKSHLILLEIHMDISFFFHYNKCKLRISFACEILAPRAASLLAKHNTDWNRREQDADV